MVKFHMKKEFFKMHINFKTIGIIISILTFVFLIYRSYIHNEIQTEKSRVKIEELIEKVQSLSLEVHRLKSQVHCYHEHEDNASNQ